MISSRGKRDDDGVEAVNVERVSPPKHPSPENVEWKCSVLMHYAVQPCIMVTFDNVR